MEPKSQFELHRELLNEHSDELKVFTRTLLTTSAGTLALLAGLSGAQQPRPPAAPTPWLAEVAAQFGWVCLCLSLLVGLAVQWLHAMQPLTHANKVQAYTAQDPAQQTPIVFRRTPARRLSPYIHLQTLLFAAAFVALTVALMTR